jgi:hypothetical protein
MSSANAEAGDWRASYLPQTFPIDYIVGDEKITIKFGTEINTQLPIPDRSETDAE